MDWAQELGRFALHAAAALVLVLVVAFPLRRPLARFAAWLGALSAPRAAALLLVATLLPRLALLPAIRPTYDTDVQEYCDKAAAIVRDGHPRNVELRGDGERFYRTLGYSLPLAGWYAATGVPETGAGRARSAQILGVGTACAVAMAIVALGRALRRETAGRAAAMAYAVFLPAVTFSLVPYAETWATLLFVGSAACALHLRAATGPRAALAAAGFGFASGLLFVTRTEFAPVTLVLGLAVVAARGVAASAAPLLVSLAAFAVPFAVNHQMRDGYPGHLRTSVQGGLILYFGQNPIEVNGHGNATPEVAAHVADLYLKDATGALAAKEAVDWMTSHPAAAIANAPKKLYHLWLAEPQGLTWQIGAGRADGTDRDLADALRHAAWAQALAVLAVGLAALRALGRDGRLFALLLAVHAAVWCVLAASTRNRYPLEPLLLLAAAAWIESSARAAAASPTEPAR